MARDIAPVPNVPERVGPQFEREMAPARPGNRGPLRYEEGIATDTDVPRDFERGATEGFGTDARQSDVDRETQFKHAADTMRERAHLGSAAWTDSATQRREFATEANADWNEPYYPQVDRGQGLGRRYQRTNVARIS